MEILAVGTGDATEMLLTVAKNTICAANVSTSASPNPNFPIGRIFNESAYIFHSTAKKVFSIRKHDLLKKYLAKIIAFAIMQIGYF